MGKTIDIGGRIHNPEVGNVVTGANEILDDTKNKKQDVINSEVDAALEALEANKQDNLTFDQTPTESSTNPVTSGGVYAADLALQQAIEAILTLIPSAASALNQLADKSFVNSSIATASATFRGTYNLVSDLHLSVTASHQDIATALASVVSTADNNDYCFVQIPTSDTSSDIRVTERYKFNGTAWAYEYDLNNSGFTAQQWEAINSGITALLVTKLGALPTAAELATSLAGKQNVLTFDNVPVSGSDNPVKSGGLYQLFTAIDAKFPSDASSSNKLVAENRLAAYVTAVIGTLDASYNVTSTDGHVTVKVTQVDGAITSVEVLTSDIASAQALSTLSGRVSANETDLAGLHVQVDALTGQKYVTVTATAQTTAATDVLPATGQATDTIYRIGSWDGTQYDPDTYSEYAWTGSAYQYLRKMNYGIDAVPTLGSQNPAASNGVAHDDLYIYEMMFGYDSLSTHGGWVDSNSFSGITSHKHKVIAVKGGSTLKIASASRAPYVILKSYTIPTVNPTPFDLATGETGRRIAEATESIVALPQDANYIAIGYMYLTNVFPIDVLSLDDNSLMASIKNNLVRLNDYSKTYIHDVLSFTGKGNSFSWGDRQMEVIGGKRYDLWIENPNISMSGVTVTSVSRLSILLQKKDGTTIDSQLVPISSDLTNVYHININDDVVSLKIGGRCENGVVFNAVLIPAFFDNNEAVFRGIIPEANSMPNIDTINHWLDMGNCLVFYGNTFCEMSNVWPNNPEKYRQIPYKPSPIKSSATKLIFNIETKEFIFKQYDYSPTEKEIVLGGVRTVYEQQTFVDADLQFEYNVDGQPISSNKYKLTEVYYGEKLNLFNKYKLSTLMTLSPSYYHQSMAIYGDIAVFMIYDYNTSGVAAEGELTAHIYSLSQKTKLASLSVPYTGYTIPHCNTSVFGKEFATENSICPLLYVSQWNGEKNCLVYDIQLNDDVYSISLVQVIGTSGISESIQGAGMRDWVVDTDNNRIYSIGYFLNSDSVEAGNKTMIMSFPLPALNDGDVIFGSEDVETHFELEFFKFFQDKCYNNGKIIVASGMTNYQSITNIRVIDLERQKVVTVFPLGKYQNYEPEGMDIYNYQLIVTGGYMTLQNIELE